MLAGYVLAQATWVALFGRLADMKGTRAALLVGGGLIAVGTVLTVSSESFAPLLAGRMLQGAGVAASPVAGFSIAASLFEGAERARAIGMISAVIAILSGSGSLIGGVLTDAVSWHAVVAIPALTLPATAAALHLSSPTGAGVGRLDGVGAGLVVVLASCVVLLLETPSIDFATWVRRRSGRARGRRRRPARAPGAPRAGRVHPRGCGALAALRARRAGRADALRRLPRHALRGAAAAAPRPRLDAHPDRAGAAAGRPLRRAERARARPSDPQARSVPADGGARARQRRRLLLGAAADGAPAATTLALGMSIVGFMAAQVVLVDRVPLVLAPEVRSIATGVFILVFLIGGAIGTAMVAGLTDPLGLAGAVACVAALPAAGAVLSLAADAYSTRPGQLCV